MKPILAMFAVTFSLVVATQAAGDDNQLRQTFGPGELPRGRTGHPIGTYITIEGASSAAETRKFFNFDVDTVNGKRLPAPISLLVSNPPPPDGKRYLLKGYETIEMVGVAPAEYEAAKELGLKAPPNIGTVWQVLYSFKTFARFEVKGK